MELIESMAIKYANFIEKKLQESQEPFVIVCYTKDNYKDLLRQSIFTYEDHMQLVKSVAEILAKKGLADRIEFEYIEASEYWRWIAKKQFPDTETVRALFAKLKKFGKLDSPIELNDEMKKDFLET